MKDKIFQRLKQVYSPLGLGDEILTSHAESLAALGLVTDANLETVVSAQKNFLEGLQRANDRRVTEATKTAKENAKKEFEEETKKKAEEEAKRKAEEEARKKAEEEAKNQQGNHQNEEEFKKLWEKMKSLEDINANLQTSLKTYKEENEKAKAEASRLQRESFILNKARELGIPQSRIDEGFLIAPETDEKGISEYLGKVATNIKATQLPSTQHQLLAEGKVDKAEMDAIAAAMVK